jgi:glyoxalase family protein
MIASAIVLLAAASIAERAIRVQRSTPTTLQESTVRFEGIHHITCITGDAPGNVRFYTGVLGLRMVKKTVNQDDPTVYHLFYADELGSWGRHHVLRVPGCGARRAGRAWCTGSRSESPRTRSTSGARLGAEGIAHGAARPTRVRRSRRARSEPRSSRRRTTPPSPSTRDPPEHPRASTKCAHSPPMEPRVGAARRNARLRPDR